MDSVSSRSKGTRLGEQRLQLLTVPALPTEDNRLGAEAFQTMMCACIGGLAPAFAGKVGKPVRVAPQGQHAKGIGSLGPQDASPYPL